MVLAEKQMIYETEYSQEPSLGQRSKKRPGKRFPYKTCGVLVCMILLNLVFQALSIQQEYEIHNLQEKIQSEQRDISKIGIEMARLDSYERIQDIAEHKLGMRMAGTNDYKYIAVVPANNPIHSNDYIAQTVKPKNIWSDLKAWFRGFGETMAKTP